MNNFEKRLTIAIAILLVIVLILLFLTTREKKGDFEAVFLDVGQGDATLLTFDTGEQMLVDCGPDRSVLEGLGKWMPFYDRTLEYLVLTHSDGDHYLGCINVLESYNVQNIWHNGLDNLDDPQWEVWKEAMLIEGADVHVIDREERHEIGETIVDVLYPDKSLPSNIKDNNASIVMRVQYSPSPSRGEGVKKISPPLRGGGKGEGVVSILLTGDAERETEEYLVQQYAGRLNSDILHAGHHGSNTSSIEEFLEAVSPEVAVISVGSDNRYGHPTRRVLKRLERFGAEIRRTDLDGDIHFFYK